MTQPHRNAVFATTTFSDAFERWKADKTDTEDVLIMRFYNEYLDDETRRQIECISDILTAPSTGLPYKQRESKEQMEQRWQQAEAKSKVCHRCKTELAPGKALVNMFEKVELINCQKCPNCGQSYTS